MIKMINNFSILMILCLASMAPEKRLINEIELNNEGYQEIGNFDVLEKGEFKNLREAIQKIKDDKGYEGVAQIIALGEGDKEELGSVIKHNNKLYLLDPDKKYTILYQKPKIKFVDLPQPKRELTDEEKLKSEGYQEIRNFNALSQDMFKGLENTVKTLRNKDYEGIKWSFDYRGQSGGFAIRLNNKFYVLDPDNLYAVLYQNPATQQQKPKSKIKITSISDEEPAKIKFVSLPGKKDQEKKESSEIKIIKESVMTSEEYLKSIGILKTSDTITAGNYKDKGFDYYGTLISRCDIPCNKINKAASKDVITDGAIYFVQYKDESGQSKTSGQAKIGNYNYFNHNYVYKT